MKDKWRIDVYKPVVWSRSYYAEHESKLKKRCFLLFFYIKIWGFLMESIQKIKCRLGKHKWRWFDLGPVALPFDLCWQDMLIGGRYDRARRKSEERCVFCGKVRKVEYYSLAGESF